MKNANIKRKNEKKGGGRGGLGLVHLLLEMMVRSTQTWPKKKKKKKQGLRGVGEVLFIVRSDDGVDKFHFMFWQHAQNNAQKQDHMKGGRGEKKYDGNKYFLSFSCLFISSWNKRKENQGRVWCYLAHLSYNVVLWGQTNERIKVRSIRMGMVKRRLFENL